MNQDKDNYRMQCLEQVCVLIDYIIESNTKGLCNYRQFALYTGIPGSSIFRWQQGIGEPSLYQYRKIAEVANISFDDFIAFLEKRKSLSEVIGKPTMIASNFSCYSSVDTSNQATRGFILASLKQLNNVDLMSVLNQGMDQLNYRFKIDNKSSEQQ